MSDKERRAVLVDYRRRRVTGKTPLEAMTLVALSAHVTLANYLNALNLGTCRMVAQEYADRMRSEVLSSDNELVGAYWLYGTTSKVRQRASQGRGGVL